MKKPAADFRLKALLITATVISSLLAAARASSELKCSGIPDKNTAILDKVQSAYKDVESLKAQFHQSSYLAALDQSDESGGEVYFQKPGKMRWNYTYPTEQFFLVNDQDSRFKKETDPKSEGQLKTVWFYQKEANQVMVNNFSDLLISDAPVAFLMGLGNLAESFELLSTCKVEDGNSLIELKEKKKEETPQKSSKLSKFKLLVDESYSPAGAEVYDIGGNITSIIMDKVQKNVKIADNIFKPDFPKGADIITN